MTELASYLSGAWTCGSGGGAKGAALLNPSTEEVVATASTEGLDLGAALAHARDEGGRELLRRNRCGLRGSSHGR